MNTMKKLFLSLVVFLPALTFAAPALDYATVITKLRPGAVWYMNGDTYAGLVWLDKVQTKPTEAEILAAIPTIKDTMDKDACVRKAKDLLAESAWAVAADSTLTNKAAWLTYRAALYALIRTPSATPVWPVKPAESF